MKIHGTLCDLKKRDIEHHIIQFAKELAHPKYICRKCVRMSSKKKHLCKPERMPASDAE